jgi:hypothetical protein
MRLIFNKKKLTLTEQVVLRKQNKIRESLMKRVP